MASRGPQKGGRDSFDEKRKKRKRKKKRMAFLVATTSLPAVYRPNGYARTTTAGTPHARANNYSAMCQCDSVSEWFGSVHCHYVSPSQIPHMFDWLCHLKIDDSVNKDEIVLTDIEFKNAGHEMAIVGEPCNVDAHAKNPALFRTMLCPRLCCVYTYTVHTDCDCTVVQYLCTHNMGPS